MKGGRKIVVVEADEATRNSLRFALEAEDFSVAAYADGQSLLDDPDWFGADAFILDHHLPDMTGPELLRRLRGKAAWGPALFLAGRITPALRQASAVLDAPILDKPLIGDALSAGLAGLLTR